MTTSRRKQIMRRAATASALLAGVASIAVAQKAQGKGEPPLTTHGSAKSSEQAEHADEKRAKSERKMLKGIKLTKAQKSSLKVTEKRYEAEQKELEKQLDASEKSGRADPAIVAKIDAIRIRERAEIRAALSPAQRAEYDRHLAGQGNRKS